MRLTVKMMRAGTACGLVLALSGCSPKEHNTVVATIGQTPVTLQAYEALYLKSNGSRETAVSATQQDREKFLDLMVNYKLKLNDAKDLKLDKKPEIVSELEQYKGSLAASFVTEREITGPGVRKLYDQRSQELRASHILITLAPNATPTDSALAYKKAYELIARAKAGEDFSKLAQENSQDPSAKTNGGDLYYFTAGQMVGPFEAAAFAMNPGEISSTPVRTNFGLHIIKLLDKKPAMGEMRASHIMVRFPTMTPTPEDTAAAYATARALQDSLKAGVDFAELAKRQSGDPGSAPRGGDLGSFGRRRWPQTFDEAAFRLKVGEVSPIVRTQYGYHLIKCTEVRPRKTFEEAKQETQQLYQQLRFQEDYNKYLAGLKKDFRYAKNDSVMALFVSALDSNKTTRDSAWTADIPAPVGHATLLSVAGTQYSVDSVAALLRARMDLSNVALRPATMNSAVDKVGEQLLWGAQANRMEQNDPAFAAILKEYQEGILLYQVEQDRVWNRLAVSDSVLRLYFAAHRDRFVFPDRLDISEIHAANAQAAELIYAQASAGKSFEDIFAADSSRMLQPAASVLTFGVGSSAVSKKAAEVLRTAAAELKSDPRIRLQITTQADTLAGRSRNMQLASRRLDAVRKYLTKNLGINAERIMTRPSQVAARSAQQKSDAATRVDLMIVGRQPLVVGSIEHNVLPVGSEDRVKRADSLAVGGISKPFTFRNLFALLRLNARVPAREKTYEEAAGEVSSAYQESESKRLEAEWLNGLKVRYPVVEHKEALKNAFAPVDKN